jgi:hypothetical protein
VNDRRRQRNSSSSSRFSGTVKSSTSDDDREVKIENLAPAYCNDFVCTSSPAVEMTVKALAKDIERGNGVWTTSLLSKDIVYKDAFCSTSGIDSFRVDFMSPAFFTPSSVTVQRMRMTDAPPSSTARIEYKVVGTVRGIGPLFKDARVEVDMVTTVGLNLLTGQVEFREDSWKAASIGSVLPWTAARMAWGSVVMGRVASKRSSEFIDKSLDSVLGSVDDDVGDIQADPRDPMKFFQQNDSFKDDATAFIIFLLVLYIIITGYGILFGSSSIGSSSFF